MAGTASPISRSLHPPPMLRGSIRWRSGSISLPARRFGAIRSARCRSSSSGSNATRQMERQRTPFRVDGYGRFHPRENQETLRTNLCDTTLGLLTPGHRASPRNTTDARTGGPPIAVWPAPCRPHLPIPPRTAAANRKRSPSTRSSPGIWKPFSSKPERPSTDCRSMSRKRCGPTSNAAFWLPPRLRRRVGLEGTCGVSARGGALVSTSSAGHGPW